MHADPPKTDENLDCFTFNSKEKEISVPTNIYKSWDHCNIQNIEINLNEENEKIVVFLTFLLDFFEFSLKCTDFTHAQN